MSVIVTENLTKFYDTHEVVSHLTMSVEAGSMFGFLGPNGAGKSTTVGMLSTITTPTAGQAWVAGINVRDNPYGVRGQISIVFQETTLDEDLSCVENLKFQCRLLGMEARDATRRIADCLDVVGLTGSAGTTVSQLSGGMRRRLEIARGIVAEPQVLFLDEPTTGLDPQTRASVWDYLEQLVHRAGCTVFLTTHHLEEADVCDRLAIIDDGKLVAQGSPDALKREVGADRISCTTAMSPAVSSWIGRNFPAQEVTETDNSFSLRAVDVPGTLAKIFRDAPFEVAELSVQKPSLDDVFLKYTGYEIRDREADAITTDMIGGPQ